MRRRPLSALVGLALTAAGLAVVGAPARAAGETRLFLSSANGGYAGDVEAEPTAPIEGYAPAGSTLSPTPPTAAEDATGPAIDPAEAQPGLGVSFNVPVGLTVTSICADVYVSGTGYDLGVYMQTGPSFSELGGAGDYVTFTPLTVTGDADVNRVTGSMTIDAGSSAGPSIKTIEGTALVFSLFHAAPPYDVYYGSTVSPSSVIFNSPTCTPAMFPAPAGGAAPAPTGGASAAPTTDPSAAPSESASASASAEPSATGSAEPTVEPEPTDSPPSTSCASATPAPGGSADPSATASADPSAASADPSATPATEARSGDLPPTIPPGGGSTPSPSASAAPSEEPSASGEPTSGPSRDPEACTPASVTLSTNTTQITAGNAPTLTGVVRNARGDAIHDTVVTIYVKGYGESAYAAAATVETDEAGQFRIRVRPLKQSAFVAGAREKRSTTLNIRVSTRVEITAPQPGTTVANPVTFRGRLNPGYVNVAVGLGYLVGGRFVVLTQARTNGTGAYAITARLPRGTAAYVVFTSAHQGTDKGSRSARLAVR